TMKNIKLYSDTTSSTLVGQWNLNETSGTTATDSSTNSNDGTLVGTTFTSGNVDITATITGTINDLQIEVVSSFTDKKPSHFIDGTGDVEIVDSVDSSGVITE
ncbi:MAG: hypothetical protein DRG11_06450, partial [Epsilonproteobacteria bacterium]